MAKKGQQTVTIKIDAQIESLEKANKELAKVISNETLISKQGNTLKSALSSSSALLEKMTNLQDNNGRVTTSELKKMTEEYNRIMGVIKNLIATEKVYQQAQQKEIDKTTQKLQEKRQALLEVEEAQKKANEAAKEAYQNQSKEQKIERVKKAVSGDIDVTTDKGAAMSNMLNTQSLDEIAQKSKESKKGKTDEEKAEIELAKQLNALIAEKIKLLKEEGQALIDASASADKKVDSTNEEIASLESQQTKLQEALDKSIKQTEELTKKQQGLQESSKQLNAQRDLMLQKGIKEAEVNNNLTKTTKQLTVATAAYQMAKTMLRKIVNATWESIQKLDKALTDMSIVTGESRDKLYSYVPALTEVAKASGITITEMSALTAEFMKQGRTMSDSISLASETAKAAKIAGISVGDSVKYMTSAINGFNLAASEATRVSDIFAKVAAASATDYEDLAIALSKVSAQANTAGMSIEFTTALLAKGVETTQEAPESIGTALKTIIARMRELSDYGSTLEDNTSVNKVENALKSVGISLRDTNGQFRDMEEIFNELGPQWDNLNTMQQQAIAQAVAGTRQQSRFLAIMQDWDRTVELSSSALDSAGASAYQYSQYTQSLEYSLTELSTSWEALTASLTNTDAIKGLLDTVSSIIAGLTKIMNLGDGFVGSLTVTALIVGTIVAGVNKWLLVNRQKTQEQISELMIMRQMTQEQAEQHLMENKTLSLSQKIVASLDRQLKARKALNAEAKKEVAREKTVNILKNKDGKLDTKKYKELKKITKENKNIDALAKGQVKSNREISKWAKENNLDVEEANNLAKMMAQNKQLMTDLDKTEYAQKLATLGLEETEVLLMSQKLKDKGVELTTDQAIQITALAKNGELTKEKLVEMGITNEKQQQLILENAKNVSKKKSIALIMKEKAQELGNTLMKVAGAIAKAFSSLGPVAGAIAAAAIAATIAGIIGASIAVNSANGGTSAKANEKRDAKMAENQNAIYEAKEKKQQIAAYRDEYEALNNKTFKTQEEMDRMAEIEAALKEIDDNITGSGQDLLNSIDTQTKILDNQMNTLIDTNFNYAAQNLSNGHMSDETKLALRQKAQQLTLGSLENESDLSDGDKAQINSAVQSMVNSLSDEDYEKLFSKEMTKEEKKQAKQDAKNRKDEINQELKDLKQAYKNGEMTKDEYKAMKKQLKNEKKSVSADTMYDEANYEKMIEQATEATTKIYQAEGKDLATQISVYKQSLEGLDETTRKMVESQFGDLAMLAQYENEVTSILNNGNLGIAASGLRNFANTLNEAGVSAEGFQKALDAVAKGGVTGLADLSDEELADILGISADDPEFQAKKDKILLQALYDLTGMDSTGLADARTNMQSQAENVNDLQGKLISGEKLTQEDEQYLAENFGDLWASKEFQESLKGDGVYAAKMLEQSQAASREDKIAQGESLVQGQKDLLQEKFGMDFDILSGMSKEDMTAQFKAQLMASNPDMTAEDALAQAEQMAADAVQRIGQIYTDQANLDGIKNFEYQYEGLNEEARKLEESTARYEALQEKIDKNGGIGNAEDYAAMREHADAMVANAQKQYDLTKGKLSSAFGSQLDSLMSIDAETNQIVVNMDEYAKLSGAEKEFFDEQLSVLEEQNDTLQEQKDIVEEINQMQRDAQVEIQNQAIAAMQARLDAEYEATQKSLDKRRELYNKYFDDLDAEDEKTDYEADRQALLNKIASLSTATDSESLSKLKEAQEALAELDDEKLSSDREMRREAVEESFDQQGEQLDAAYESAMSDVQGMWEEFCTMAGEDQLALFQQYGEGFQEVTDLQKQMAMETLDATMEAIASYGFVGVTPTPKPAYAEGGLVDFTGPAWVDGSKTKPEAFLDPEDTANIGALAQGLRAMVNNIFSPKEEAKSIEDVSTLNIEEFNINVGLAGNMIETGRDVADGFMKAIRELGININKKG